MGVLFFALTWRKVFTIIAKLDPFGSRIKNLKPPIEGTMSNPNYELIPDLIPYIKSLKVGGNGRSVIVNNLSLSIAKVSYETLTTIFPQMIQWPHEKITTYTKQGEAVVTELLEYARKLRDTPPEFDYDGLNYDSCGRFPASDTDILILPKRAREYLLFNRETRSHETVDRRFFNEQLNEKVPKGFKHLISKPLWVDLVYCPDLPSKLHALTPEEQEIYPRFKRAIFNSYVLPKNRSVIIDGEPRLHPTLRKFFDHLFVNEESREYIFRWMYTLTHIFHRTTPVLILCGKAGTGKNTFVERILVGLVGEHNFHKAAQLSERFNSSILNCQLHFADEGTLDGASKRNLKGFHEMVVAVERKGVDVEAPERIFARFVIATNLKTDIKLDGNDRKFSVPELAEVKFKEVFSAEESDFLFNFHKNVEAQAELLDWLARTKRHDNPETPYHGTLFKEICWESLPAWFQSLIGAARTQEEFTLKELKRQLDVKNISLDKIRERLFAYEHEIGKKLISIEQDGSVTLFKSHIVGSST